MHQHRHARACVCVYVCVFRISYWGLTLQTNVMKLMEAQLSQ